MVDRQVIRPDKLLLQNLSVRATKGGDSAKIATILYDRFSLGYIISRWRAETGEEVAAFTRGKYIDHL
jgi:hypothetical protein